LCRRSKKYTTTPAMTTKGAPRINQLFHGISILDRDDSNFKTTETSVESDSIPPDTQSQRRIAGTFREQEASHRLSGHVDIATKQLLF